MTAKLSLKESSMPNWATILLAIAGMLIPAFISKIQDLLRYLKEVKDTIDSDYSCAGIYNCEYQMPWKPEGEKILVEKISLKKIKGEKYTGYVIERQEKDGTFAYPKNTVRLDCQLFHKKYLIGRWRDPEKNTQRTGSFMLEIDENGKNHLGDWSGWSNTNKRISSGRWSWKKDKKTNSLNLFRKLITKRLVKN